MFSSLRSYRNGQSRLLLMLRGWTGDKFPSKRQAFLCSCRRYNNTDAPSARYISTYWSGVRVCVPRSTVASGSSAVCFLLFPPTENLREICKKKCVQAAVPCQVSYRNVSTCQVADLRHRRPDVTENPALLKLLLDARAPLFIFQCSTTIFYRSTKTI